MDINEWGYYPIMLSQEVRLEVLYYPFFSRLIIIAIWRCYVLFFPHIFLALKMSAINKILQYCISLYFRVQLFSRICSRETFREFLFSRVVMSWSWVRVVIRHFVCFYFRICEFIREIRENKCLAWVSRRHIQNVNIF